ncbi:MAG: hypothetical protein JRF02_07835, partial [Deltaproteobacteria bacterium]|nr:hypothetical protein [Deltaproteobacteria bacterium]
MRRTATKTTTMISFFLLLVLELSAPGQSTALGIDEEGTSMPPFLGTENVQANMLLLIDNSYSMYDLVYVETRDECFDDSFQPGIYDYAGYFLTIDELENDTEVWYEYDSGTGQFKRVPKEDSGGIDGVTTKCNVNYDGDSDGV